MERPPWRWNLGFLATFAAVVLLAFVIAAVFAFVSRFRIPWAGVVLAIVAVAAVGTLVAAVYVPVGVAVTEDALHLRYLRRWIVVPWRDVLGISCGDDSVAIRTVGRRVHLEHPGTLITVDLLRAAKRHGIGKSGTAPDVPSDLEPSAPPPMPPT